MRPNTRFVTFPISKSLRKPLNLPDLSEWKVHHDDSALSGQIHCYTKSKGLFFEHLSDLALRFITITHQGFIVIYEKKDKGFVLNIRDAKALTTFTDTAEEKSMQFRRCHLKLKYKFGTVNMFLMNDEICVWKRVITDFHDGVVWTRNAVSCADKDTQTERSAGKSISQTSVLSGEELISEATKEEELTNKAVSEASTSSWVASCALRSPTIVEETTRTRQIVSEDECAQLESQLYDLTSEAATPVRSVKKAKVVPPARTESGVSSLFTENTDTDVSAVESVKSVRCGVMSVATLRRRLENKLLRNRRSKNANLVEECPNIIVPESQHLTYFEPETQIISPVHSRRGSSTSLVSCASSVSTSTVLPPLPKMPPPASPVLTRKSIVFLPYTSWDKSVRA